MKIELSVDVWGQTWSDPKRQRIRRLDQISSASPLAQQKDRLDAAKRGVLEVFLNIRLEDTLWPRFPI